MLILFDHGAPRGAARVLSDHTVITAYARGWDRLQNGELLNAAEEAAVDLLLTTDRKIAILVFDGRGKVVACPFIS